MVERRMWEAKEPVTVEALAAELDIDLETHGLQVGDVEFEHVHMASSVTVMDTHSADADVWRIRYAEWHKVFRNVRDRAVTVIQFESGGLSGGDGWAACKRYKVATWLSDAELTGLLPLLEAGILPHPTYFEEF